MTETGHGGHPSTIRTTWTANGPVVAITEAVATVTGREVEELPPLYDYIEMEALERLLTSPQNDPVTVSFGYEGTMVSVESTGDVFVTRREHPTE